MNAAATTAGAVARADWKVESDRIARAALASYELRKLASGRWLISRWNLSKELADSDVDAFLKQVGAPE
jgi:hypothetical protein